MPRENTSPYPDLQARIASGQSIAAFLFRRVLAGIVTLLVVTALLYAVAMSFPVEMRARLHWPEGTHPRPGAHTNEQAILARIIERHGLDDPFHVQYVRWLGGLLRGNWGYSPSVKGFVLPAMLRLTPATAELALYSVLAFLPMGLISGVLAGWKRGSWLDHGFRAAAFIATSLPPFILALLLMSVFYVGLHWFPPERLDNALRLYVATPAFHTYTGLLTLDGLLNGRPDVTLEALRHLVLPVFTLSLVHWATLGRVTRVVVADELGKDYLLAARARGVTERRLIWRHTLKNALVPALNTTMLSTASLFTGVFVVESIFNFGGVSRLVRNALVSEVPDLVAALGFTVYSVLIVLIFMTLLDLLQALVDPRLRERLAPRP